MSGGHFEYKQYKIGEIADDIEHHARDDSRYDTSTLKEFQTAVLLLRRAEVYAQRIDWLLSGDDGEDTFHARLAEDLAGIK